MPLRLALCGCSQVRQWTDCLQRLDDVSITNMTDTDPAVAEAAATQLETGPKVTGCDQLLSAAGDDWDALLVSGTPTDWIELTQAALAAGRYVLLEQAPRDEKALSALAAANPHQLMAGGRLRYAPALSTVQQSVASGQIGDPGLLRAHRWVPAADISGDASLENGLLLDEIDLALWLFGQIPDHVLTSSSIAPGTDRGCVQIHLGFPDNGMALLDWGALIQGAGYFSLSLIGSQGAAYADDHHNTQLLFQGGAPAGLNTAGGTCGRLGQLREFITAIVETRSPGSTISDARAAAQVQQAACNSLTTGQAFRWTGAAYQAIA
ncbi:MAG: hypothetical protein VX346_04915 [Planctomycetota bacterium]|nr:hypothetical protein [Planctomycetota bacterium]